ncbi:acyl-CoA thioesterase [Desulfocurvus sp. DL9XJH121]
MSDFPTPDCWLEHRVSYGETDAMKVVYYGEYLHYFERARGLFIREHGMSYATVEERGIYLPIRESHVRHRRPVVYDALILIRTGISDWGRASVKFGYEIWNETRETLHATGWTEHACVNAEGRPVRVPDWLKELFV